jgi:hypothetical protein
MASSNLCQTCRSLNLTVQMFAEHKSDSWHSQHQDIALTGRWGELKERAQTCDLCRLIERMLLLYISNVQDDRQWQCAWVHSINSRDYAITGHVSQELGSALCPNFTDGKRDGSWLAMTPLQNQPDKAFWCRVSSPTVPTARLRGWLDLCESEHGPFCPSTIFPAPTGSVTTYMVDVSDMCLRLCDTASVQYAALSYVWGDGSMLKLRKSCLEEFCTPDAFQRQRPPRTISEAIDVTASLGLRYLWVDSLCIVQDEEKLKHRLIESMTTIYGHAQVTLAAVTGTSANDGLSGWTPESRARWPTMSATISSDLTLGIAHSVATALIDSEWVGRGWM